MEQIFNCEKKSPLTNFDGCVIIKMHHYLHEIFQKGDHSFVRFFATTHVEVSPPQKVVFYTTEKTFKHCKNVHNTNLLQF